MVPVIALIGRTNVGKSTLFNRLTRTHDALVADFPGLTRDRRYGYAVWRRHKFIVIDTSGIANNRTQEKIEFFMFKQTLISIEEADIVLFIVDGQTGLVVFEKTIARHLRHHQKITFIVVNKVDGPNAKNFLDDFYTLGISNIVLISALYNRGINKLLEQVLTLLNIRGDKDQNIFKINTNNKDKIVIQTEREYLRFQKSSIKLAIVGRPNVGKSTLINCIVGKERVVVNNMPGTTRDDIFIPIVRNAQKYILIDTAGIRKHLKTSEKIEKFSIIRTLQVIENANVVLLVINVQDSISDQDLSLLNFIIDNGRSLVIAMNKSDLLSKKKRDSLKKLINLRLNFIDFVRIHFISALYGDGIDNLFASVNEAYQSSIKRITTGLLIKVIRRALDQHQPPLVRGRLLKPKYAHIGGYDPLVIVIHGINEKDLSKSYKRYLMNYFHRSLNIIGTPIRMKFKSGY